MIRIIFEEPADDKCWQQWREECGKETSVFIGAVSTGLRESYLVKNLYKKEAIRRVHFFRDDFKGPFWRKCAYCEDSIAGQDGDVEHFRPKGRLSDDNYQPVKEHLGYYWLAYDWRNLLPSCLKCNQKRKWEKEEGVVFTGKQDRFPLEPNSPRIYSHEGNIEDERPLLINPLIDDPEEHLEVDARSGFMLHKTMRGQKCIEIFGLNIRDDLRDGRKGAIQRVKSLLNKFNDSVEDGNINGAAATLEEILKFVYGEKRFSIAARCFLKAILGDDYKERLEARLCHFRSIAGV